MQTGQAQERTASEVDSSDAWPRVRRTIDDTLAGQRRRLEQIEGDVSQKVEALVAQLAADERQAAERLAALDQETTALRDRALELAEREARLAAEQTNWDDAKRGWSDEQGEALRRQEAEIAQRRQDVEAAEARLVETDRTTSHAQQVLASEAEKLAADRRRTDELRRELEEQRDRLAEDRARTKTQRKAIAQQFRAERAEQLAGIETLRADITRQRDEVARRESEVAKRLEEFAKREGEFTRREDELSRTAVTTAEGNEASERLRGQIEDRDRCIVDLSGRTAELERQLAAALAGQGDANAAGVKLAAADEALAAQRRTYAEQQTKLAEAVAEAKRLSEKVAQLEQEASAPRESDDGDELRRRLEMAIGDLREQKARSAELEEKLAQARRGATTTAAVTSGFDWEAAKRQMLESLDDFDETLPEERHDRMKIEDTIRITDEALAQKEHEIHELKQLLHNQSSSIGSVAVGAAAIAQMLDQDELVGQERERLRYAQDEWREKLRAAEIELSMERAKIGRERTMLEERLQKFEEERAKLPAIGAVADNDKDAKGKRRWLSRLGIRDTDTGP